ncbi:MAG: chemotaxis protein [Burkholderiales bacterium PBB5]|nr:MAG: chemotaxis protein [Burkholderiales bacterium PBB5]
MFASIQRRLTLACVAIVVLALFAITAVNIGVVRHHAHASTLQQLNALSQAHASAIASWVERQKAIVGALTPAARVSEPVPFLVQAQKSGGLVSAYAGFADKRMLFDVPQQLPEGYNPTQRPWYQAAAAANAAVLTAPYADAATKRLIVTFAMAVRSGSAVDAVVASDVFIDDVSKAVASIKPTANGLAFLVNQAGQVIAHPDTQWVLKPATGLSASLDAAALARAAQADGGWTEARIGDHDYLLRGAPVAGTDWTLVSAARADEALAEVRSLLGVAAGALLVMTLLAAVAATWAVGSMLRGLARVRDAMTQIGQGEADLSLRLPDSGRDEIAQIAGAFNRFTDKLSQTIHAVRLASDSIATASAEIATGNTDLSHRTEQTASNLQQTASALEQLTGTVRHSADGAATASQLAGSAAGVAQRGGEVVAAVVATMDQINSSSKRIADIIGTIDGIAFQTNILALNAAVEAARAGEQGRGFAVVASEVRSLAQRSAEAAREIKALIGASVERVEAGSRLVADAGSTMTEIVGSVQRVTDVINEISAASKEQSQGIGQVNGAVTQLLAARA